MPDVKDFLAGWFGGVVSLIVSHPLDTVKVRQQAYNSSMFTAIITTFKYEGFRGFYKGLAFPLITYGPSNSIFFGVYGNWLRLLDDKSRSEYHQISPSDYGAINRVFQAGCVAGVVQTVAYCPVEYVKILLQANTGGNGHWEPHYVPPYKGTMEAIKGIYQNGGVSGLFRGLWPMCLRDVPTGGVYVLTYEMLRHSTLKNLGVGHLWKEVIAGGIAGILSIVSSLPLDVIKTHLQTDDPKNPIYKGTMDCFRKLYAAGGMRIFFKGLPIICLRAFPAHAVMFVGYEYIMSF